jgi:hypothetical protein
MMRDLAYFLATGVQEPLHVQYADREGFCPGAITFTMRPQPGWNPGLLTIELNLNSFNYTLVDCTVQSVSESVNGGEIVWQVSALDRRFRWKYGIVSGMYNRYLETGAIWKRNEKNPQELLKLLFEAMGEKKFDVSRAPTKQRYEMRWEEANAATEADELCRRLGCRLIHKLDDSYAVVPIGEGQAPQVRDSVESFTSGLSITDGPDSLEVHFRRRAEVDVRLQAVGFELDGEIKPIDELSYRPTDGWDGEDLDFSGVYDTRNSRFEQELARCCIWRYFQVTVQERKGGRVKWPGYAKGSPPDALEEVLPVFAEGVANKADLPGDDWFNERRQPLVWGRHCNGSIGSRISLDSDANDESKKAWEKGPFDVDDAVVQYINFGIDCERGLIIFDEPIFAWEDPNAGGAGNTTPDLTARLTLTIRDQKTLGEVFYSVERKRSGPKRNTKPLVIRCDEATYDAWFTPGGNVDDNKDLVQKIADHYLDQAEKEFQRNNPMTVTYSDWRAVEMSGAITEVTWASSPGGGPTTQVSYNDRHQYARQSYNQVRLAQAQRNVLDSNNLTIRRMDTKSVIQRVNRESFLVGK